MNPLALLSLEPGVMLKALLLMFILVTLFLLFGLTAARVPEVTFMSASIVAVSVLAAQFVVVVVLSVVPEVGGFLGFIFGSIAMVWVIRRYFDLTWTMAGKAWGLTVMAEVTAGAILWLYLGIGLTDFIHAFFFIR